MADFNTFVKTTNGKYAVTGGLTIICAFLFYLIFFYTKDKDNQSVTNDSSDINVRVKDTTLKQTKDVYTAYDKKTKRVEADADFFKTETEEMKQAYSAPVAGGKSEEDLQRMADSILKANQTKVNYGQPAVRKSNSYGGSSYSSAPRVDKAKLKQEEIDKFQKKSKSSFNDFFDGANAKKNNSVSSDGNGSQQIQKNQPSDAMIYAVISGDQIIKNKDRVTMKLTRDALINGEVYKKNTFLYGIAKFTQNRVNLDISNINQKQVSLSAQDAMDGNKGIYIEGESLIAEATNEASEDAVRDINVRGIPVGKTIQRLVSKKQKESKVQLLNNYKIILKTE